MSVKALSIIDHGPSFLKINKKNGKMKEAVVCEVSEYSDLC